MKLITSHTNTDFDGLASMVAAGKLYPDAVPVVMQTLEGNVHSFMRLHSDALCFRTQKDIPLDQVTHVVLVDTQDPTRLEKLAALAEHPEVRWIIYDHHPLSPHGLAVDRAVVEPVGSTTTLLVNEIRKSGFSLSSFEATVLALGIYEDSGNLTFPSTAPADAEAVAFLLSCGANLEVVNRFINRPLNDAQQKLLNDLVQRVQIRESGNFTVLLAEAHTGQYVEGLSLVTHKLLDLYNASVAVTAVMMGTRTYIVSRSRVTSLDARLLIAPYNPKGQPGAACGRIDHVPPGPVLQTAQQILQRQLAAPTASMIMSSPIRTISSQTTIEQARRLMLRYGYEGLPVVKKGRLIGLVTRPDLDRAYHHWLTNVPVGQWMGQGQVGRFMSKGQVLTVPPDAPLGQIQRLMIEHDVGLIPVAEDDTILGIVTRGDVLRELYGREYGHRRLRGAGSNPALNRINLREAIGRVVPPHVLDYLRGAAVTARHMNYSVYLVGGGLRDILLERSHYDIDLVVEGDGIRFARELAKAMPCELLSTHDAYGTAKLKLATGEAMDIASAREEFYEFPAADPQVEFSTIQRDLYRRDFTVNALAVRIDVDHFGDLVDFFGGYEDLQHKTLRVLHNLSFIEDPTRLFRAVRFEQKLGFRLDQQSDDWATQSMATGHFDNILNNRTKGELKLILNEVDAVPAIERLAELGGLRCLQSDLVLTPAIHRKLRRVQRYFRMYQRFIGGPQNLWVIYLNLLLSEGPRRQMDNLSHHLGFTHAERVVLNSCWSAEECLLFQSWEHVDRHRIHDELHRYPPEVLLYLLAISPHRDLRSAIRLYWMELRNVRLFITGHDLRRLGLPPGPLYRDILQRLLRMKLDGLLPTEEDERQWAERYVREARQKEAP